MPASETPLLYGRLAGWFHLLTAPADYADEAAFFRDRLREAGVPQGGSVLELGAGGGNNASHLKQDFRLTLTDVAPAMLAVSRSLNPECEHVVGDMRTLRLGRTFDAVFLHDAVMFMTDARELRAAVETAWDHCRPGGTALFVPDWVRETYTPDTRHGGHDGPDGRGLRYLEWCWDPDPSDTSCVAHLALLLREADGSVRCVEERHVLGLLPLQTWLDVFADVGFETRAVVDGYHRHVFVARRPVG
jgi:SAM-dependent methyltransferase